MPRMTMIEAIRDALDVMMGRDDRVVVYGEDVGYFGGVFRCTDTVVSVIVSGAIRVAAAAA